MIKQRHKIFIGLAETSGYYSNLKKGFLEIGQECVFFVLDENKHKYCGDDAPNLLVKLYKYFYFLRKNNEKANFISKFFIKNIIRVLKILIFIWALINYDVFIIAGISTFFNYWDFPILKFFNKKIVNVHLGSGSRPPFLDGTVIQGSYSGMKPSTDQLVQFTLKRKKELIWLDKYTDILIDHPPQAYFHERDFISLIYIGIPFSTDKFAGIEKSKREDGDDGKVRILHAPSFASHKGTDEIRGMINELIQEGYRIDYKELTNLPNETVLKEIQNCDFVVDELYSDSPMATLAAEAAFFGKPTVVGGYFFDHLDYYYDGLTIPPTVRCNPTKMKDAIVNLIIDKDYRKKMGIAAQNYVLNIWAPRVVALKYLSIINNDFPRKWLFNPDNIEYLHGYGMSEEFLRNIIKDMVGKKGSSSLQLADKPKLEKRFLDFFMTI